MKITKLYQKVNDKILEIEIPDIEELDSRYLKIDDATNTYATKTEVSAVKDTADTALPKTEAASTYATKTELATKANISELSKYLPLTGGTLTGNVSIERYYGQTPLTFKFTNLDAKDFSGSGGFLDLRVNDKNDWTTHYLRTRVTPDKSNFEVLARNTSGTFSSLSVVAENDGTLYATAPTHTSPEYSSIIVTEHAMQNYAPQKLTSNISFYVNTNTGSDTVDLFNGRGFSTDKPFKTLSAAVNYANTNCVSGGIIEIILCSDITVGDIELCSINHRRMRITSDSTQRKISTPRLAWRYGTGMFTNLHIESLNSDNPLFWVEGFYGSCTLMLGDNLVFSGAANTVVACTYGAKVIISGTITGNITGKRYSCATGGRIFTQGRGAEAIPGTMAGTCDSTSTYF